MAKPIVIVGTGSFGQVAREYFTQIDGREVVAFSASAHLIDSQTIFDTPLLPLESLHDRFPASDVEIYVAIGYAKMNEIRERFFLDFLAQGYDFASFIHPSVKIWDSTTTGRNCFVFEDNTIQPFTTIGDNTVLWSGNHIGHHARIGKNVFVSSHVVISGSCSIGDNAFLGVNATIHDGVAIGNHALIGAGSIISRDVDARAVHSPQRTAPRSVNSAQISF